MSGNEDEDRSTGPIQTDRNRSDNTLSTGLENLNEVIEGGGFLKGSVIAVSGDPASLVDVVSENMIAKRPSYYFTLTSTRDTILDRIEPMKNVNLDYISVQTIDVKQPIQDMNETIEQIGKDEFPNGGTIIVNPTNPLESRQLHRYKDVLQDLRDIAVRNDAIIVLNTLSADNAPEHHWVTKHFADTVLEIVQESSDEKITYYLSVDKLHPHQSLISPEDRMFELDWTLDIDVATSRNISP